MRAANGAVRSPCPGGGGTFQGIEIAAVVDRVRLKFRGFRSAHHATLTRPGNSFAATKCGVERKIDRHLSMPDLIASAHASLASEASHRSATAPCSQLAALRPAPRRIIRTCRWRSLSRRRRGASSRRCARTPRPLHDVAAGARVFSRPSLASVRWTGALFTPAH
jgi:hypothetical protein